MPDTICPQVVTIAVVNRAAVIVGILAAITERWVGARRRLWGRESHLLQSLAFWGLAGRWEHLL